MNRHFIIIVAQACGLFEQGRLLMGRVCRRREGVPRWSYFPSNRARNGKAPQEESSGDLQHHEKGEPLHVRFSRVNFLLQVCHSDDKKI